MNTAKKILGSIVLIIFLAGIIFIVLKFGSISSSSAVSMVQTSPTLSSTTSVPLSSSAPVPKEYTMAEVATHNSATSCWTTINNKVYDLTSWINEHPGGPERILSICGIDGTQAFEAQHAGQTQPADELKSLYIGNLVQ